MQSILEKILDALIDYWKKHPSQTIAIILAAIFGGMFILEGETFYKEKIQPFLCQKQPETVLPNETSKNMIRAIDAPILLYRKEGNHIYVVDANKAGSLFYNLQEEQIKNKTPTELHSYIKPYMSNYPEWTAEQNDRLTRATRGEQLGKSEVPMKLNNHPQFQGDWYLASDYFTLSDNEYVMTRFFKE